MAHRLPCWFLSITLFYQRFLPLPQQVRRFVLTGVALLGALSGGTVAVEMGIALAELFAQQVDRQLTLPAAARDEYAQRLDKALAEAGLAVLPAQYFVLVDRNLNVQAGMIYWKTPDGTFHFLGASPVSTGKPDTFEHFETPTGVFDHAIVHGDFRAESTKNTYGIRGYGRQGVRVYDFGWQSAPRDWGTPGEGTLRLQMHATDPDILEPRLGCIQSKGCIRIPATLNTFLDRYGILDADYERAAREGQQVWVLRSDRQPTPWSGRYLVVVDSQRMQPPGWALAGATGVVKP